MKQYEATRNNVSDCRNEVIPFVNILLKHDQTMLMKQFFFGMQIFNSSWGEAATPFGFYRWDAPSLFG